MADLGRLVRRAGSVSEGFWDCLDRDGPQIPYVISNSGFPFRQNGVQFALSLGGNGPISKQTYAVF
jgi:hypothetical protein